MSNPFSSFYGKPVTKKPVDYEEVEGAMDCQFCRETVGEGKYYPLQKVLRYVCSKEHINILEDFNC